MTTAAERPPLPEGPYLIVGLARSGVAAARMLRAHGDVIGTDSGHPEVPDDLEVVLGGDGLDLLYRAGCVVKSPGVPADAPVIAEARERGLPVLGELELAWRLLPNRFVAVTGTNGKTTAVEQVEPVAAEHGLDVVRHVGVTAVGADHVAVRPQHAGGGDARARQADDQVGPFGERRPLRPRAHGVIDCW